MKRQDWVEMLKEKGIKQLIIVSVILIEVFVWTAQGAGIIDSVGIIGGADGPTKIFVSSGKNQHGSGLPEELRGEEENQGQRPGRAAGPQQIPEEPKDGEQSEPDGQAVESVGYPAEDTRDKETALQEAKDKDFLILVNKQNPIDQNYKPEDLRKVKYYAPDRPAETRYLRADAEKAFDWMVKRAAEDGVELKMTTAYRSYGYQTILFQSYVDREGEEKANTYSAKPGQSEHQTGLSVDVSSPSVDFQLSNEYGKTTEGKWIAANAYRFGFILRFPEGKEDITGYQYEPWHLRYVGLFAAKEIYEQKLTLEEYLAENEID